jgi:hypothetical protein
MARPDADGEASALQEVTYRRCGRVHIAVSRAYAEAAAASFNDYMAAMAAASLETREAFANRLISVADYERCRGCGGTHKDFRLARTGDAPAGCTLNPILRAED